MDKDLKKAKLLVIFLFLSCLCAALACFGVSAYLIITNRGAEVVDQRMVTISKTIVFVGIFFLVLAFGHLLPTLVSGKKRGRNSGERTKSTMSDIFDEANMKKILGNYIPAGESLLAGIHAVSKETNITGVFGKCARAEDRLIPDENGGVIALHKKKYSSYDVYAGITQSSFVIAGCEKYSYFYQFDDAAATQEADICEVTKELPFADIGTCFPLTDIKSCEIKKGWMGSVKCFLTMKNGSYFKLMCPKLGGLGNGMPHHAEHRAAIIARLGDACK